MQRLAAIREGGGAVKPSIDVAMKAANFFGISIDYMTGSRPPSIIERVATIRSLPDEDQEHILFALDAMIRDAKSRFA